MNYQLTNEQADELRIHMMHDDVPLGKLVSEWLSANLPAPVPVLRPIQEMPPEVPEGGKRLFIEYLHDVKWFSREGFDSFRSANYFLDFLVPKPPDPEAELRRGFEKWAKAKNLDLFWSNGYVDGYTLCAWEAYKARKEAK